MLPAFKIQQQSKYLHTKRETRGHMKDQTKGRLKPRKVNTESYSSVSRIWGPCSMIYARMPLQFC